MKMTPWLGQCLLIGVLVATSACSGTRSGTPSPVPSPSPMPSPSPSGQPAAWQVHLSGVVRDDAAVPVPGATVTVYPFFSVPEPSPVTAIADANGRYSVSFLGNMAAAVAAQRDGFERAYVSAGVRVGVTDARADITVYPILRIMGGESRRVVVPPRTVCGLEDEFQCRSVRVVAPTAGTVVLRVTADSASTNASISLTSVAWPQIPQHYPCCGAELRQTVSAGDELVTAVMIPWTEPPGAVLLQTHLQ